jgi:hypothetical protein
MPAVGCLRFDDAMGHRYRHRAALEHHVEAAAMDAAHTRGIRSLEVFQPQLLRMEWPPSQAFKGVSSGRHA